MSWQDLENKGDGEQAKRQKEHAVKVAKNYAHCFSSDAGKEVLQHLVNEFVMGNSTALSSSNINYEAAYHNGESGVVKYILNQIERAQKL